MSNRQAVGNDKPIYNIKAISKMTGLLPVTLRAWERRYGVPHPQRGEQGYRLYSEEDLRTLQWLKAQVDAGMSISRAVQYLTELRESGKNPLQNLPPKPAEQLLTYKQFRIELMNALKNFDEVGAGQIIRRSFALFSVKQVLLDLIQPTLVEIGEMWHRREIPIATEHFATHFFIQHIMGMINNAAPPTHSGTIIAACAPTELHEIGILMIVALLRWRGWEVKYLGANLDITRIDEVFQKLRPRIILFSATSEQSAQRLAGLPDIVQQLPEPQPMVVLGGQGFNEYKLSTDLPIIYINSAIQDVVNSIENLMQATDR